jgi:hypothetical protein
LAPLTDLILQIILIMNVTHYNNLQKKLRYLSLFPKSMM